MKKEESTVCSPVFYHINKHTNLRPNDDAVLTDRRKHGGFAVDQRTSRESALCFAES